MASITSRRPTPRSAAIPTGRHTSAPARASSSTARSRCASTAGSCAAPSQQAPYHLNASLGEFMFGVSRVPEHAGRPSHHRRLRPPKSTPTATACSTTTTVPRRSRGQGPVRRHRRLPRSRQRRRRRRRRARPVPARGRGQGRLRGRRRLPRHGQRRRRRRRRAGQVPDRARGPRRLSRTRDGCPDPDNDGDGVHRRARTSARTKPRSSTASTTTTAAPTSGNALVVVSPDRLELLEASSFKKTVLQKDELQPARRRSARRCARTPRSCACASPSTSTRRRSPRTTSACRSMRAFAIREWLIKYGIDEKRLDPRGFGGQSPLVDPKSKSAKEINERVDLSSSEELERGRSSRTSLAALITRFTSVRFCARPT